MHKKLLVLGLILGGFSIIFGAFASHGLESKLSPEALLTFETGARYQMYQALFLIGISFLSHLSPKHISAVFFSSLIGVLFFSGSIYGLSTNSLTVFDFTKVALITPIGGSLLIFTWFFVAYLVLKKSS